MDESRTRMGTQPVLPLLASMAVPMMLSMLVQSLYNIVDSIYVARLGTDALTAVSLAYPLQNIVLSAAVGMGVGVSSVLSISLGEGDRERANETATLGMALTAVHCVLFVVLGLVVTRPFLRLFTQDEAVLAQACDYTYVVLCWSFGCLMQIGMEKIYQGLGEMKVTMVLLASGCVINIVLDPILIFGLLGFPAMGVKGAAIATVAGQIAAFFLYVIVYCVKNPGVTIHPRYLRPNLRLVRRIYSIGIPSTLMLTMPSLLIGALNAILAELSDVYVAVLGVYYKLQTFIYMPANGIVQGMRPLISYNYGAGKDGRVRSIIRYSLAGAAIIMLAGTAVSLAAPGWLLHLFDADAQLMDAGCTALRLISLGFLASSVGVVFSGVFEALGKGVQSLAVSLLRQLAVTVPLGWALSRLWGAAGIWTAFPLAEAVAAAAAAAMLWHMEGGRYFPGGKSERVFPAS